jgi:hypothetical protein
LKVGVKEIMNNDSNNYYLYQGKIYQCSDVTAEAELYGADSSYGYGKTLLFLDEIGEYVDANDCVQVAPNFWQHFEFWVCSVVASLNAKIQDLRRPKYDDAPFDDYVPFDDCEF